MSPAARAHIRLAELLGVLSFGADLGMGLPMEHVLRQCLISLRLADRMGLDEADRVVVYYTSLLAWVGCHVDAYEQAKWFGDDMALKTDFRHTDFGPAAARPLFILRHLGAGRPLAERARLGVTFPGDGRRVAEAMIENHWLAADGLGERLGLPQRVRDSVEQTFERWDGKGVPKGARGEQILLTSRLVALADVVEVFHRAGGTDAAVAVARLRVRHRAGSDRRLHRCEVAVHHRPFAWRGRPRRGSRARPRPGRSGRDDGPPGRPGP
jgi:hypothetical protein